MKKIILVLWLEMMKICGSYFENSAFKARIEFKMGSLLSSLLCVNTRSFLFMLG